MGFIRNVLALIGLLALIAGGYAYSPKIGNTPSIVEVDGQALSGQLEWRVPTFQV